MSEEASAATAIGSGQTAPASGRLDGRWRELPRSPFAAWGAASAWTGSEMIVVDGASRRSATFNPAANEWSGAARPPKGFPRGSPSVWTGNELIILSADTEAAFGLAYDPQADGWREISEPPVEPIHDAVWAGDRLVAATRDLESASYDPVEDCWSSLPAITGHPRLTALYPAGDSVLAVTEHPDASAAAVVSVLDPLSVEWVASEPGPSAYVGIEDGLWVDGRLVFLLGVPNEGERVGNVSFDPVTNAWEALDVDCAISTREAVWTGQLIINGYWHRAYDPHSGRCFRLPRSGDRQRRDGTTVWTGRQLIHWSGGQGEELRALPDGMAYRPPKDAAATG